MVSIERQSVKVLSVFLVLAMLAAAVLLSGTGTVIGAAYGGGGGGVVAGSASGTATAAAGGTIALGDGSVKVALPAGAVSADVTVTISPVDKVTQNMAGYIKVGSAIYELVAETADGTPVTSFDKPVTLEFTYKDADLGNTAEANLMVYYWDTAFKAWIAVPTSVDKAGNKATATVSHFTVFALLDSTVFKRFNDMAGHWAEGDVLKLSSLGVTKGYADGGYHPGDVITRAQFTNLMAIAAGLSPVADPQLTFADADKIPVWSRGYVAAGIKAGLINGYPDNTFRPDDPIDRAQMAKLLAGVLKLKNKLPSTAGGSFTDSDKIPGWAKDSVGQASAAGLIKGNPDGSFAADRTAIRAEAATMISRLMDRLTK